MLPPIRILHLIDGQRPGGGPCTMRMAADVIAAAPREGFTHEIIIIGTRAHVELAQRCGLRPSGSFAPIRPPGLGAGDHRAVEALARRLNRIERADVVHDWNTLRAAPYEKVGGFGWRSPEQADVSDCTRCLTVVNPAALAARAEVRAHWDREHGIAVGDVVIGLLGEPVEALDAHEAAHAAARLILAGRRVRLMIAPTSGRRAEAERFMRNVGFAGALVQEDGLTEPWRVAAGLDAVIAPSEELQASSAGASVGDVERSMSRSAGPPIAGTTAIGDPHPPRTAHALSALPAVWAFAAGAPVVRTNQSRDEPAVLSARRSGPRARPMPDQPAQICLIAPSSDVHAIAHALALLLDDPSQRAGLTAAARQFVMERCTPAHAAESFAQAWRAALAEP